MVLTWIHIIIWTGVLLYFIYYYRSINEKRKNIGKQLCESKKKLLRIDGPTSILIVGLANTIFLLDMSVLKIVVVTLIVASIIICNRYTTQTPILFEEALITNERIIGKDNFVSYTWFPTGEDNCKELNLNLQEKLGLFNGNSTVVRWVVNEIEVEGIDSALQKIGIKKT